MKKTYLFAIAAAAVFASCSSDEVVNENVVTPKSGEVPIEFNVQKQNITRAANLETVKHYNFGVWAWKVQGKNSLADAEVMNNYLVGYSNGSNVGYDNSKATTYATTPGSTSDHVSPWFYEGLGTAEYTYTGTNFYTSSDADYMSNNTNQYLRYWDLAYEKTNFYCYAPYNKSVTFAHDGTTSVMTFPATGAIRDGYDEPLNSNYDDYSRTLGEFMYAGVQSTNSSLSDVTIPFQHMGAQLFIRFYEDIPGYKVEIIDLNDDNGTTADLSTALTGIATKAADIVKGIQATPSIKTTSPSVAYSNGTYYTTQGATVSFAEATAAATYTPSWTGSTTVTNTTPLMFKIPTAGLSTAADAPANLTAYSGHNIIKEKTTEGTQAYSYSPTIYYPVAQPTTSTTGFTFHVSYRIIAEDNKEVITVHNATVHVPVQGTVTEATDGPIGGSGTNYYITAWRPNVKYTYTFKITKNSTGTTNPDTAIDPTDPEPSTTKSLYPIVFDAATIDDYSNIFSEYIVSEDTSY